MRTTHKTLITAVLALVGMGVSLAPVSADPPANSGWDLNPDVAIGGGSDTTYLVSQRLETLYNGAPGCAITTSSTSANKGRCADAVGSPASGPTNGNYDHDLFVSAAATGSGAGTTALAGTQPQYNPAIDYARSSSGPSGTITDDLTYWGYARDGIAVVTFGSRQTVSLSKDDLKAIYQCQKTNWSEFGQPAGTIIPWDMNTSSGTRATFVEFLDNITFGSCVRKLAGGAAPFENDVKPILADPGPVAGFGADDDENNYLWWMSFGAWTTYPYAKNGFVNGQAGGTPINSYTVAVNGATPSANNVFNSTYAIMRSLYHVTRNTDADCRQTPDTTGACDNVGATVYGNTTGKGGAVRNFTQWLCRTANAQHAINPVTGVGYRSEIIAAINAEGFQQLSSLVTGLRTPGYACAVAG